MGAAIFLAVLGFCLSVPSIAEKGPSCWAAVSSIGVARDPSGCCMHIGSDQRRDHRACITWRGICVLCSAPVAGGIVDDFYPPEGLVLFAKCIERTIALIWPRT
jgi:hypothetical protein